MEAQFVVGMIWLILQGGRIMVRNVGWTRLSLGFQALLAFLIAALALTFVVTPAEAAPRKGPRDQFQQRSRTTTLDFFAFSEAAGVNVFQVPEGFVLCVNTNNAQGCTLLEEGAVTVDQATGALTVAPTTVQLITFECPPWEGCEPMVVGEVTVAVTFEPTSGPIRFKDRHMEMNGCKFMFASRGTRFEGVATITLDGQAFSSDFAGLTTATQMMRVQCKGGGGFFPGF
jgi:hypothetical protein